MRHSQFSILALVLVSFFCLGLIHAVPDARKITSKKGKESGPAKVLLPERQATAEAASVPAVVLSAAAKGKKQPVEEVLDEEEYEEYDELDEIPEKPTGISYYASSSWYFLKDIVFLDMLWAYALPAFGITALDLYNSGGDLNDLLKLDEILKVVKKVILPTACFNAARFILGEISALFLSNMGYFGSLFMYSNGATIQTTRFLGVDMITVTWTMIRIFQLDIHTKDIIRYVDATLVGLVPKYQFLGTVGNAVYPYIKKGYLAVFPYYQLPATVEASLRLWSFGALIFLALHLMISKYMGMFISLGGITYAIKYFKDNKMLSVQKILAFLITFVTSVTLNQLIGFTVLGFFWFVTISASHGSTVRAYPREFYPQGVSVSIGSRLVNLIVYIIHDLGISVVLCFIGGKVAYKKFEEYLKADVFPTAAAHFDTTFPLLEKMWKKHAIGLVIFKLTVTILQKFAAFILNRHFPFPLDSSDILSINWRFLGIVDLMVPAYFMLMVYMSLSLRTWTADLKAWEKANQEVIDYKDTLDLTTVAKNADKFLRIAPVAFLTLDANAAIVLNAAIDSSEKYFILDFTTRLGYGLSAIICAHAGLSLFPKILAGLVPLGLAGYEYQKGPAAFVLKPQVGQKYVTLPYCHFAASAVPLWLNYEVKAPVVPKPVRVPEQEEEVEEEEEEEEKTEEQIAEEAAAEAGKEGGEGTEETGVTADANAADDEAKKQTEDEVPKPKERTYSEPPPPSHKKESPIVDEHMQEPSKNRALDKKLKNGRSNNKNDGKSRSRRSSRKSDAMMHSTLSILAISLLFI